MNLSSLEKLVIFLLAVVIVVGILTAPGWLPYFNKADSVQVPSYEQDKTYADAMPRPGTIGGSDIATHVELRLIRQLLERLVEVEEAKLSDEHSD